MATKFFNNENGDTLFAKLKGIAEGMGVSRLFCWLFFYEGIT